MKGAEFKIKICLCVLLFCVILITPVYAGEKYSSGQPEISAGIEGSNELMKGEKTSITLLIANSGLVSMKFIDDGSITPDFLPTTALSLSAFLETGESPIVVSSDPQIIGDLPSGSVGKVTFSITVPDSARAGTYQIPVLLMYRYMNMATQTGLDEIAYSFKDVEKRVYLPVTIRPAVRLEISGVKTGDLTVGGEGNINITITNTGSDDGKDTVMNIEPVGNSPVIPYQNSVYVGDFPKGSSTTISYKVSVSSDADPDIQYPMKLWADYTDYQGLLAESGKKDVSVGFKPKINFTIVNSPNSLASGGKGEITVEYKNTGVSTVYNAQAGINIVDPFTSEDDQSYLGNLAPGETGIAKFKLNVNDGATPKQYALDSDIRYMDEKQTEFVSDPLKVPVNVTDTGIDSIGFMIIFLVLICGGGFVYYRRKQQS